MRMLQRDFDVETRYGGGFVQEIDGIAGGREDGRPVDWFYYVNGILAEDGAAAHELEPGDRIWWDHHDWGASADVRAVVGAFPEPFRSGLDGKRLPVRLDCADAAADACDEVARAARRGRRARPRAPPPRGFGGEGVLRVKVGRWADLRRDSAVRRLEEGPKASGVYAQAERGGRPDRAARPRGRRRSASSGPAAGSSPRRALGGEAPTWIVTGTDEVGLAAAAAQLERARAERAASRSRSRTAARRALPLQPPPETP